MRNLKRALSLALAFVMVMSLMIVGTSAKSYTDADKIDNQVAVEILGEIGVMVGNDDGSFAPDRDVTRAEMAVILTRILYGNNMNVDQFKNMNTFTDVPDWAEGFVNLCASLDIIAGRGNGIFDPDATVTSAEAALMLSRALGYFKNNAEFGNDWALAAMKRATQIGIIGGDMVLQANAGLDRDDVAQMTFNTLTKAVPVQYNEVLDVYYNENQGVIYALEFNYLQTLGYKNFSLVYKTNDTVEYGRPATTWGIGSYVATGSGTASGIEKDQLTADGGLIASKVRMLASDEIITVNNTPTYVYTQNTKEKDIYSDLGADVCTEYSWWNKDGYTWTAYINGEEQNARNVSVPTKNSSTKYEYTDKGTVTEIYVDDDAATVTVVEINYYLGQVYSVENGTTTIRSLSPEGKVVLDDRTFATEEFEDDDYVVFTVDYNDDNDFYICEMMAPETVTGEVVRVDQDKDSDDTYIRLDDDNNDKIYYTNTNTHMAYDVSTGSTSHPDLNEEYILYMTPDGYVLGFELAEEKVPQYLFVTDSSEQLRDWTAKVILTDATEPKVDLDSDLDNTEDYDIGDEIDWIVWTSEWVENATNIDELIWDYSVNSSDVYSLTYVPQLGEVDVDGNRVTQNSPVYQNRLDDGLWIRPGKSYVNTILNETAFIVDESTIFVDTINGVSYTGYSEVPTIYATDVAYVVEDGKAKVVFVLDGDVYDENMTYFILEDDSSWETKKYDGDFYRQYEDSYVDGKNEKLMIAYDALNATEAPLTEGNLYRVTKSFVGTDDIRYITEVQLVSTVYPEPVNVDEPSYVGDNSFRIVPTSNENWYSYTTNADTQYVLVERNAKDVKAYEAALAVGATYNNPNNFEWNVLPGKLGNMDDDRLADYVQTYVTVAKAEDNVAELVYIYQITPDINPEQYTVRLVDAAGNFINSDRVEKGQTASIAYTAPAGYKVVLDNAAAKYEDGKVILPNVTANTTIKVTLEKILGEYTLTLKGNLNDATVWSKDGTQRLDNTSNTATNVDGDKIVTLPEGTEVIVKDPAINAGRYMINGKIVDITKDDQLPWTLDNNTVLDDADIVAVYTLTVDPDVTVKGFKDTANVAMDALAQATDDKGNTLYYFDQAKAPNYFTVYTTEANNVILTQNPDVEAVNTTAAGGVSRAVSITKGEANAKTLNYLAGMNDDAYLYPAAALTPNNLNTLTLMDGTTQAGKHVNMVVRVGTSVKMTSVGTAVFATTTGANAGTVIDMDNYVVTSDDVTLKGGYIVTLNGIDSVKVKTSNEVVTSGMVVAKDQTLDYTTFVGAKHVIDTTVAGTVSGAKIAADVTVGKNISLSAATALTKTANINDVAYVLDSGRVQKVGTDDAAETIYIVAGQTIQVTGNTTTAGTTIKVTATDGTSTVPALTLNEAATGTYGAMVKFVLTDVDLSLDEA